MYVSPNSSFKKPHKRTLYKKLESKKCPFKRGAFVVSHHLKEKRGPTMMWYVEFNADGKLKILQKTREKEQKQPTNWVEYRKQ